MTTLILNFTLVGLTFISTLYLVWLLLSFKFSSTYALCFSSLTHLSSHHLYHRIGRISLYKPKNYFTLVSICKSSICQGMRFIIFLTTKYIKLIRKKEFAATAFNLEYKTFIVHIRLFSSTLLIDTNIYPSCRFKLVDLILKKASTIFPAMIVSITKMIITVILVLKPRTIAIAIIGDFDQLSSIIPYLHRRNQSFLLRKRRLKPWKLPWETRFFAPRQAGKGLILLKNLFGNQH